MGEFNRRQAEHSTDEPFTEIDLFTQFAISLADRHTEWGAQTIADVKTYLTQQSDILNRFTAPRADHEALNDQLAKLAETYPEAPEKAALLRENATVQLYTERYQGA